MEMMEIVYSPLLEEEEQIPELDWEKQTVKYLIDNKNKVMRLLNHTAKKINHFTFADAEDTYVEALLYFREAPDYDISIAISRARDGKTLTLENYVNACIKCVLNRQISKIFKRNNELTNVIFDNEGKEESIFSILLDVNSTEPIENIGTDIKIDLDSIEYKRYIFGVDLFQLLYIRLLSIDIAETKYRSILEALGITKQVLKDLEVHLLADEDIMQVIKAISVNKNEKVIISALEKKVYGAKTIKETIERL